MIFQAPMSFQWTREGGSLPVGRSQDNGFGLLVLTSVEEDDSGTYVCTVTAGIYSVMEKLELAVEDDRPETTTPALGYDQRGQRYYPHRQRDEEPRHRQYYPYQQQESDTQNRETYPSENENRRYQTEDVCPGFDIRLCPF